MFNPGRFNKNGLTPDGVRSASLGCLYSNYNGMDSCARLPNGGCRSPLWRSRMFDLLGSLKEMRRVWCQRPDKGNRASPAALCGQKCVVVVKIFQNSIDGFSSAGNRFKGNRESLKQLLAYPGTQAVVTKRDPDTEECSLNYSLTTDNWHSINRQAEHAWQARHCRPHASSRFVEKHNKWFDWVYSTLHELGKQHLELSFEKFVSDVPGARRRLHKLAHLPEGKEFEQPWCDKTPGRATAEEMKRTGLV
jgi:hypothetical protein